MRVLVIPEDFRNDQYILKQLILGLFRTVASEVGKSQRCARTRCLGASKKL